IARFWAVVLLPSCATADVTTTCRGGWSTSANFRFVRRVRKDSTIGLRESITGRGRRADLASNRIRVSGDIPVTSWRSSPDLIVVSSCSRVTAKATPTAKPPSIPTARLSGHRGDTGLVGRVAGVVTVTFTGYVPPYIGVSSFSISDPSLPATLLTIAAARRGFRSTASMFTNAVSGGF